MVESQLNSVSTCFAIVPSTMRVRLTKKHAERIDGIDLKGHQPGDLMDLPAEQARLIVAEEWAIPERRERRAEGSPQRRVDDRAANRAAS